MPKIHANKNEIKLYYQTHNEEAKEVAKKFNIPLRTLSHWISTEKWIKGQAIEGITAEIINNKLINKEFGTAIYKERERIHNKIRHNLGDEVCAVDEMILNNLLQESTEKLLLKAIGLNYIQNNIALSAIIARDELLKLKGLSDLNPNKAEPLVIASAEKVQKTFLDLKNAFYGKDVLISNESVNLDNLSDEELLRIIQTNEE